MSKKSQQSVLDPSWSERLEGQFSESYMENLRNYLTTRKKRGVHIFPHSTNWFRAFTLTPFDSVKVVILGQDPYHGFSQAHGLCFSVAPGIPTPPSLKNIYKEIESDLGLAQPKHGCLDSWAEQGVFLLNSVLTVEQGHAASHQGRGWEQFTDKAIADLSEQREHIVFMLWGAYAQKKGQLIDRSKNLVLSAPHPSPLSAHRGFLGCRHFSQANEYLQKHAVDPINWELPYIGSVQQVE